MTKRNDAKLFELLDTKGFSLAKKWNPIEKYGVAWNGKPDYWHLSREIGVMVKMYPYIIGSDQFTQAEKTRYVKYCKVLLTGQKKCLDYEKAYVDLKIRELYDATIANL